MRPRNFWFGFELPRKCHPVFPWWQRKAIYGWEGPEGKGWKRADGARFTDIRGCHEYRPVLEETSIDEPDDCKLYTCSGCFHHRRLISLGLWEKRDSYSQDYDKLFYSGLVEKLSTTEFMALLDKECPLAPPPPRAGQVWLWPESQITLQVLGTKEGKAVWPLPTHEIWPPENAILIHGNDFLWAPPSLMEFVTGNYHAGR